MQVRFITENDLQFPNLVYRDWEYLRNYMGANQSPEDNALFNWFADYIYPVIDGQSNWEPSADMYPYDYQY